MGLCHFPSPHDLQESMVGPSTFSFFPLHFLLKWLLEFSATVLWLKRTKGDAQHEENRPNPLHFCMSQGPLSSGSNRAHQLPAGIYQLDLSCQQASELLLLLSSSATTVMRFQISVLVPKQPTVTHPLDLATTNWLLEPEKGEKEAGDMPIYLPLHHTTYGFLGSLLEGMVALK